MNIKMPWYRKAILVPIGLLLCQVIYRNNRQEIGNISEGEGEYKNYNKTYEMDEKYSNSSDKTYTALNEERKDGMPVYGQWIGNI